MTASIPNCRFRPTPPWLIFGLLVVEGLLWLSEQWFRKGWALLAAESVGVAIFAVLGWFVVSFVFRWGFHLTNTMRKSELSRQVVPLSGRSHLFIVLMVLLLMSGSCVARFSLAMHQFKQATKPFQELGGWAQGPEMGPLDGIAGIKVVGLDRTETSDADLLRLRPHLEALPNLEHLLLFETPVTDAGLEYLKGLTKLERLDLSGTKVTDAGVANLQQSLPNCKITR
jgi:hypothetical protein